MEIPRHIAIIMDGNGRWAKRRMLPRSGGHRAGMKRMISLSEHAFELGVKYLTLYALSSENLSRPRDEVEALFDLIREYFSNQLPRLLENEVALRVIGDLSLLPDDVADLIRSGEERSAGGTRGVLTLAIAYGGRQEILNAVNLAVERGERVDAESFQGLLWTAELPDPDLLIRTGKEKRISNFLLWQSAYTEFYFSDKMFPAFTNADLDRAIEDYAGRERRFGKVGKTSSSTD